MWAEIFASRPFIFAGGDHCWVCDGVEAFPNNCTSNPHNVFDYTTYWHMNFGWAGASNGYYSYGAINPVQDPNLNLDDKTIMQIHP